MVDKISGIPIKLYNAIKRLEIRLPTLKLTKQERDDSENIVKAFNEEIKDFNKKIGKVE